MNRKKIAIFIIILLICPSIIIIKDKLNSKDDIYVLTEENTVKENNDKIDEKKEKVENIREESKISNKEITVFVSGEVNKPGVVTLKEGERLAVAVEKLGGTTKKADLNNINLAMKVKDEEHYIIPKYGDIKREKNNKEESITEKDNSNDKEESQKININTASIEELDKLPGVGEATANKIVNHRKENGDFKNIEEIKNVNGIGDKKFENRECKFICALE